MIKNKKGGNMKEMTMPLNYVELEQEEMMYLEGGGDGWNGVEVYWWGVKMYINRTTLNTIGTFSFGAAAQYIQSKFSLGGGVKGYMIAGALAVAGFYASNMSSGVWIRYTLGVGLSGAGRL